MCECGFSTKIIGTSTIARFRYVCVCVCVCVFVCVCVRERERERVASRQTGRQSDKLKALVWLRHPYSLDEARQGTRQTMPVLTKLCMELSNARGARHQVTGRQF